MPCLIVRELIQFCIADSKLGYFKKKSNLLELSLIAASYFLIFYERFYRETAAFIIIISSIEILMLQPNSTVTTYMYMLKTVTETFIKFFRIVLVIIFAFAFSFFSLFRPFRTKQFDENGEYLNSTK